LLLRHVHTQPSGNSGCNSPNGDEDRDEDLTAALNAPPQVRGKEPGQMNQQQTQSRLQQLASEASAVFDRADAEGRQLTPAEHAEAEHGRRAAAWLPTGRARARRGAGPGRYWRTNWRTTGEQGAHTALANGIRAPCPG
jgi:hypothetical protein